MKAFDWLNYITLSKVLRRSQSWMILTRNLSADPCNTDRCNPPLCKSEKGKPEKGKPETGKPEACKPEAGKPEAGKPETGKSASPPEKKKPDPRRVIKVYRYDGILTNGTPRMDTFELDVTTCGPMMLDALIKLKDMDPSLTFRRSCREGICGSCGICLQGHNCLACTSAIPKETTITVHPLPHMYVIRDLVVDMTHFIDAYNSIQPYLIRKGDPDIGAHQYAQSNADMEKLVGLYECILCSCCATACPSYWWNGRRFLGPAALLHAYKWVIDSRDEHTEERLKALTDDFKAYRCHTIMNCTLACPKGLNPGMAIAKLKRLISKLDKKPTPDMDPMKHAGGSSGLNICIKMKKTC